MRKTETVDDFAGLLKVMNTPELTEFQYLVSGDEWTVSIR
jgi:8-oxo-dGTP diphosphatase